MKGKGDNDMSKGTSAGKRITAFALMAICLTIMVIPGVAYADSKTVAVDVRQEFTKTGTNAAVNETFNYEMTPNETGNPMPAGSAADKYVFPITGSNTASFSLTFVHAGIYQYTVKQAATTPQNGYTYDASVYTLIVNVSNNSQGGLETLVQLKKEGELSKPTEMLFTNAYQPKASDPAIMVDPPVRKTVTNKPATNGRFQFILEATGNNLGGNIPNPMPDGKSGGTKTIEIDGEGQKEFGAWSYTQAGTYYYRVKEGVIPTGYTGDSTIYTITDVVTDSNGQLVVNRTTAYANGTAASVFAFNNTYVGNPTPKPTATPRPGKDGPKTGDEANNTLWIVLLCVAAVIAVGCVYFLLVAKKKSKDQDGK